MLEKIGSHHVMYLMDEKTIGLDKFETVIIANGQNFPDGLCGGPLAFFEKAPLILTAEGKEMEAKSYVSDNYILKGTVLGGDGVLPDHTVREVFGMADNELILGAKQE